MYALMHTSTLFTLLYNGQNTYCSQN